MTLATVSTLVLIAIVAAISPVLAECTGRLAIPGVVVEILLGIVVGPAVLGLAHPGSVITALESMGLSCLMFLAGFEIDLSLVRGRPLRLAATGWVISLALAVLASVALTLAGSVTDAIALGLALTTTALGTLLPILRDSGLSSGRFGTRVMAIGSVGEFGPVLAIALLLNPRNPVTTALLLAVFAVAAVSAAVLASRPLPPRLLGSLHRHLHSSAQLPIRMAVVLIASLTLLAFKLGFSVLLGAFAAGIIVRLLVRGQDSKVVREKLEAIGFGFLVPIFFIVSGMQMDVRALFATPAALLLVPLFLALLLIVRGAPVLLLYRRDLPRRELAPLALLSATGLPLIVVITSLGVTLGSMRPVNAAALVAAGMLSVLLYPMLARLRMQRVPAREEAPGLGFHPVSG
jgi:Kef-type K+ transport system membrane component KefB